MKQRTHEDTTKLIKPRELPKLSELTKQQGALIPTLKGELELSWKWNEYATTHQLIALRTRDRCGECGHKNTHEIIMPNQTLSHYTRLS